MRGSLLLWLPGSRRCAYSEIISSTAVVVAASRVRLHEPGGVSTPSARKILLLAEPEALGTSNPAATGHFCIVLRLHLWPIFWTSIHTSFPKKLDNSYLSKKIEGLSFEIE